MWRIVTFQLLEINFLHFDIFLFVSYLFFFWHSSWLQTIPSHREHPHIPQMLKLWMWMALVDIKTSVSPKDAGWEMRRCLSKYGVCAHVCVRVCKHTLSSCFMVSSASIIQMFRIIIRGKRLFFFFSFELNLPVQAWICCFLKRAQKKVSCRLLSLGGWHYSGGVKGLNNLHDVDTVDLAFLKTCFLF